MCYGAGQEKACRRGFRERPTGSAPRGGAGRAWESRCSLQGPTPLRGPEPRALEEPVRTIGGGLLSPPPCFGLL